MRSIPDDRTARAVIRDEALALFAEHGPDAVTVRRIATAAGVSPGLVVHHFGSKDGLRQAVDDHVLALFEGMLGELTDEDDGAAMLDPQTGPASVSEAFFRHLPPDSPLPRYLRRLMLTDGPTGRELFRRIFAMSRGVLDALAAAGLASPGRDPDARAAFLTANDLAFFLLRDQIADVLGVDPMSPEGMTRLAPEMLSIYAAGLTGTPEGEPE